jgi:hypothetical protein
MIWLSKPFEKRGRANSACSISAFCTVLAAMQRSEIGSP